MDPKVIQKMIGSANAKEVKEIKEGKEVAWPQWFDQALRVAFQIGEKNLNKLGSDLKIIWPQLAKSMGRGEQSTYTQGAQSALAYAAYYLPANVMKMPVILSELQLLGASVNQWTHWVDVGTGPGTALAGVEIYFRELFPNQNERYYLGLDQSPHFVNLARQLFRQILPTTHSQSKFDFKQFKAESLLSFVKEAKRKGQLPDVFLFSNTLVEWGFEEDQTLEEFFAEFVGELSGQSKSVQMIFCEPGSRPASRLLLQVRQKIVADFGNSDDLCVWTPCLDERPCGAIISEKDWCHEEVPFVGAQWHDELGALAGLKKENLIFSYLCLSVGKDVKKQLRSSRVEVAQSSGEGTVRVVSQRMEEKGLTKCFVCTRNGRKQARVIHSRATENTEPFLSVQRGELFSELSCDDKGSVTNLKHLWKPE